MPAIGRPITCVLRFWFGVCGVRGLFRVDSGVDSGVMVMGRGCWTVGVFARELYLVRDVRLDAAIVDRLY